MTVIAEYIIIATLTLIIEHLVKYSVDRYRMKRKCLLNEIPDRRIWDHKQRYKKSC